MMTEHDRPTGRGAPIDDPLGGILASVEDLVHELAAGAEAAREHLLAGDRGAADAALRRVGERGRQLKALRDRLLVVDFLRNSPAARPPRRRAGAPGGTSPCPGRHR